MRRLRGGTWATCRVGPETRSTTAGGATRTGRRTGRDSPTAQLGSGKTP